MSEHRHPKNKGRQEKRTSAQGEIAGTGVLGKIVDRRTPCLLVLLIIAVAIFVFKDFLFLKKVYLFKDIGSDSINQVWPDLAHLTDYLRSEGLPRWTFQRGMGQNLFPLSIGNPFLLLFLLVDRDKIPYVMAYVEVLKILLSGLFFFLYLRAMRVSRFAQVIGGLLFAFNGYLILVSGWWPNYSMEALCAALLLYSFEKFFKERKWVLLPIPIALFGFFQPFFLYLYALFLFGYGTIRFLDERGSSLKNYSIFLMKLFGIFLVGVGLSSVLLFANIRQLLESPRVTGDVSYFGVLSHQPIFAFGPVIQYVSIVLRPFSNDFLGTGNFFKGWENYYESPALYCGLISVLLWPQFLSLSKGRRRILYLTVTAIVLVSLLFPYIRHAFWGFTGDYFRTYSFLLIILALYFGCNCLSQIEMVGKIRRGVLFGTLIAALAILYLPFAPKDKVIDRDLRDLISGFLLIYTVVLSLLTSKKYQALAQTLLLVAIGIELAYLSSITVNRRDIVTAEELKEKKGYNDYSVEALQYINSSDKSFFRINKDYFSTPAMHPSLNDPMIQSYKGTSSYYAFNQKYYIDFLRQTNVIPSKVEEISQWAGNKGIGGKLGLNRLLEGATRWAIGLTDRPLLQAMASVKYSLTKRQDHYLSRLGYEYLNAFGNVRVYRNKYFLPLGFTYDRYILQSEFSKLSRLQKEIPLLKAFVIGDEEREEFSEFPTLTARDTTGYYSFSDLEIDVQSRREDTLAINHHSQNDIKGTIHLKKQKLLFFSIPFDRGWSAKVDGKEEKLRLINIGFMGLPLTEGTHTIELEFKPPLLREGALISLISLLVYGSLFFLLRKKGKVSS